MTVPTQDSVQDPTEVWWMLTVRVLFGVVVECSDTHTNTRVFINNNTNNNNNSKRCCF